MKTVLITLAAVLSMAALPDRAAKNVPVMEHCLVSIIDEAQVPAREAGELIELPVREGVTVKKGQLLGRIDDKQPRLARNVALTEQEAVQEKFTNEINKKYAEAAAKADEYSYLAAIEANRTVARAVSQIEVNERELKWKASKLQIEKASLETKLAGFELSTKTAEVKAADEAIARRQIIAPQDGIVVKVNKHVGEFVQPGDPVFRIVNVEKLRVQGYLDPKNHLPAALDGRAVTVDVELVQGRRVQFPGKIVFVSPLDDAPGVTVFAEVENRKESDHWLLRPGQEATMTIETK